MRLFAKVRYDGSTYAGWQKQINEKTIQEEIEKVFSKILNTPINIYASGRTDAGVHALGQTFHFDIDKEVDISRLRYSSNMLLPNDIHILELKEVKPNFHARFSAKGKKYQYQIYFGERNPFYFNKVLFYPLEFDLDLFKEALSLFKGEHNYMNFTSKEEDENNFIRRIDDIDIYYDNDILKIDISGNGFMRYMIRDIIGTALAVASHKENLEFVKDKLNAKERNISPYKIGPEGLYLIEVYY